MHYTSSDPAIGTTIEISFDESIATGTLEDGDIVVGTSDTTLPIDTTAVDTSGNPQIFVNTSKTTYNNVENVSISGIEDGTGNEIDDTFDVTFAPTTVNTTVDDTSESAFFEAFSGENVALESDGSDTFDIEGPGVSRTRGTGSNSQIYVLNTDDFETGEYNITNSDNEESVLDLRDLGLDVEAGEDNFTTSDDVTATVTSDAIDRDISADVLDEDGDSVADLESTIDDDGEVEIDFGALDETGIFTIEVTDDNSGVSAETGDFEITEAPEGDLSFEETFITQERGDNANITINFQGDLDTAYLTIGDEEEVGYETNVTVDADGEDSVTVGFNTYLAGNTSEGDVSGSDVVFVADSDSDATVTFENESSDSLNNMLAAGTYPFEMSENSFVENANDNADAVGDLELTERGVDNFRLWTTSTDVYEDVEDVEDITGAVENETVVQTSSLTEGDVLIHELTATGLEGAIDANGDSLADLIDAGAVDVRIRQTSGSTAPNAEPKQVDVGTMIDEGDVDIISTEGSYFIAFQESNIVLTEDDRSIADEDEFEVRVQVRDERLLDPDEDELDDADGDLEEFYETATVTFEYLEATGEFDTPVEVTSAEGQTITGETNAAPGQELTVRVRSDSEVSPGFVLTAEEVAVQSDGTFEAELDFTDASVGDNFTVTAQQSTFDAEEDGTVVEADAPASASFQVSDLNPQDVTATVGDTLTVTATVENTGEQEGTQTVEFRVGGNAVASQDVTLAGGNSTTVEFADIDTSGLDAGDYEHGVFTDNDDQTATLTLEAADTGDDTGGDDTGGDDTGGDDTGGDDTGGDDTGGDDTGGDDTGGDDTGSDNGTDDGGSTDGSTPGFGAVVALVALIAAALLATRRND
ncbi:BGTF surface domain-containing protein [Halorubrum ezzemoulense]|uniref:BGTF surface domain-containing protein n=1 Tax=Halorubrum ezzemoulense TaxID=337243 RepID=UPI000B98A76F|nr:BGTF surface domain-containing protein [Halorubrum ezzemoulense]